MPEQPRYRFHGRTAPTARTRTPIRAEVAAGAAAGGIATLRLYDPIDSWGGPWGVSAKEFTEALDGLTGVDEIRLHINSPGGEVFEGIAILNALRAHPARVTAVVDGLAASAASFIAAGADEVVMGRNTELMIHDAWGIVIGPAADLRDAADRLDHLSDNIASIYQARAGGTVPGWRAAMLAETWYSAEEAVTAGLADRVEHPASAGDDTSGDQPANGFDLSMFRHPGRASAPQPPLPAPGHPAPAPAAVAVLDRIPRPDDPAVRYRQRAARR
jgi:ATP-dependent protease ClpP protease subunit